MYFVFRQDGPPSCECVVTSVDNLKNSVDVVFVSYRKAAGYCTVKTKRSIFLFILYR